MTDLEKMNAAATAELNDLFCWVHNPSWAQEGGEHFDRNWVPDCGGKQDYDPVFMRFSSRVYPDGDWVASLYVGDDCQLETTGIQNATDVVSARSAVEAWCVERAKHWSALVNAYRSGNLVPVPSDDAFVLKLAHCICQAVLEADFFTEPGEYDAIIAAPNGVIDYLDQGRTDFKKVAQAVIAMMQTAPDPVAAERQRLIDIAQACLDQGYPLAVALEMMKGEG